MIVLQKLEPEEIEALLRRALAEVGSSELVEETISSPHTLASMADHTLGSVRPHLPGLGPQSHLCIKNTHSIWSPFSLP